MKIIRRVSVGLVSLVIIALVYQVGFSTLIKPWELHRSLQNGCNITRGSFGEESFSLQRQVEIGGAFTRASWLDHNYLPLAQASVLYAKRFGDLGDLETNEVFKATTLLIGFCLSRV